MARPIEPAPAVRTWAETIDDVDWPGLAHSWTLRLLSLAAGVLLWQLAYTEFYFTDTYWPDFDGEALARAIESYGERERRFGRTSAQLEPQSQKADTLSC